LRTARGIVRVTKHADGLAERYCNRLTTARGDCETGRAHGKPPLQEAIAFLVLDLDAVHMVGISAHTDRASSMSGGLRSHKRDMRRGNMRKANCIGTSFSRGQNNWLRESGVGVASDFSSSGVTVVFSSALHIGAAWRNKVK